MEFQAYTILNHPEWACIHAKAPDSQQRTPVHLCCVIDTSASMDSESKLHNVKHSLQFLLDFLGPNDKISIVTFSDHANCILKQISVSLLEKENIRTRISIISSESNTNLSAGIISIQDCLLQEVGLIKQGVLLLTDGVANVGMTYPDHLVELVNKTLKPFPGTSMSCIGYGTDHNVPLLQKMSAVGGGSYYVVNNLEDVATVFGDILGGLVSCSFQNIRVRFLSKTEVKTRYAVHDSEESTEVIIGDLPAGMEAIFLAKVNPGASIMLKGFALSNHYHFDLNTHVQITSNSQLQTNGEAHYLRFEVVSLIEEARNFMNPYAKEEKVSAIISNIVLHIQIIEQYRKKDNHSLWDILLHELNQCKRYLENRRHISPDTPYIMLQHTSTLGRMRGISASASQDQDLPQPVSAAAFSNRVQRHISAELQSSLVPQSQVLEESQEPGAMEEPGSPAAPRAIPSPIIQGQPLHKNRSYRFHGNRNA
jgi:hypothetical protein